MNRIFLPRILLAPLTALLFLSAPAFALQIENLAPRLAKLEKQLEEKRVDMHIPGMAIAIVHGDAIIYAHGFGSANLDKSTPVTPETLFAVGSTTKAFTASLIGMLVDEGKMSWDDSITKYLPYFTLAVKTKDADTTVTIRDLLAHRTGFTRMGILWAGGAVTPEEVLRVAAKAQPWGSFRGTFYYNNVTVMAAGIASGVAAETSWGELLQQRILNPLGMDSTSTTLEAVENDPRLSLGYEWREASQRFEQMPMRILDAIAPAGAINSNVLDMAQWLRFQLGKGIFAGHILLSKEQHQETWNPQIAMDGSAYYGFGWMVHPVAGVRTVEHGGNIDGFAAQVALFPEEDLGFVLLTNVSGTPLQSVSMQLVAETLLGEWSENSEGSSEAAAFVSPSMDLSSFVGKYEANFATFHGQFFTVQQSRDGLAIDVPGQMLFELAPPDEQGLWYFRLTKDVAVSFDHDEQGAIVGLKMHQSGMVFELPREGVVLASEIDSALLQRYLGIYHSDKENLDFTVKVLRQRLAVDVPGEMAYELHLPNKEGVWTFRAVASLGVFFTET